MAGTVRKVGNKQCLFFFFFHFLSWMPRWISEWENRYGFLHLRHAVLEAWWLECEEAVSEQKSLHLARIHDCTIQWSTVVWKCLLINIRKDREGRREVRRQKAQITSVISTMYT